LWVQGLLFSSSFSAGHWPSCFYGLSLFWLQSHIL
jgi:hypothetical protein